MNKRAFTLIEMLLVLSIIGILFLLMRPLFENTSHDDPKDCLQSLYQQTNRFIFEGSNPQAIVSGDQTMFPDTYRVEISGDSIDYIQQYSGEIIAHDSRSLNTHTDICSIKNTELMFSGDTQAFQMQNQIVTITNPPTNNFTGSIELRQCKVDTACSYIGQMLIDTRTQRLYIPSS